MDQEEELPPNGSETELIPNGSGHSSLLVGIHQRNILIFHLSDQFSRSENSSETDVEADGG